MTQGLCPVCEGQLQSLDPSRKMGDWTPFECPNCGRFRLSDSVLAETPPSWTASNRARAVLSHAIYRMQGGGEYPLLTTDAVSNLLEEGFLPTPAGQADRLVTLLAGRQEEPGQETALHLDHDRAAIGAQSDGGVAFVAEASMKNGFVNLLERGGKGWTVMLTFRGWQESERLAREANESRVAFMAMEYGNPELEEMYRSTFRPAVKQTGFDLVRLDVRPPAGLIDVRMRAELRRARFVIADLTHKNAGAYWEAGFAEGLGRPVIYTCERRVFEDNRTHFDTNHSHHVLWDSEHPEYVGEELKATIRSTLPADAIIEE